LSRIGIQRALIIQPFCA